jgi:hypothetical protein
VSLSGSRWAGNRWAGAPLAGVSLSGDAGAETSIAFDVPGSTAYPADLFHVRRGLVGGSLARAWVAFDHDGTTYVPTIRHGGSYADPVEFVASLTGATAVEVDLGASDATPEDVADAIVLALDGEGIAAVAEEAVDGRWRVTVTGPGVGNLVIPPDVDTSDESLRGMWGAPRDDWGGGGDGQDLNQNGGTGGTGSVHLGQVGTAGRVIGVYLWTRTDTVATDIRLWASTGPAYSATPGQMTTLSQGRETIQGFGCTVFDAVAFGASDELWAHYRSNTATAGIRFRAFAQTPVGRGQLGSGEVLVWDTTASASAATAAGATYTPTADATFNIYVMIGVVFEVPDGDGNYPANGRLTLLVGDHNPDVNHGTQFDADAATLTGECTAHRIELPDWPQMRLTTLSRVVAAIGADEDSRAAVYSWADLDLPSTTPATRIADLGPMDIDAVGRNTLDVGDGLEIGSDAVAERTIGFTFNYIRDGGDPTTYALPVFLEPTGDGSWLDAWTDDREAWHDYVAGACGIASGPSGVIEYRTRVSAGNTGMPTTWGATYPATYATDASDDSPPAIPLDQAVYIVDGITQVEL